MDLDAVRGERLSRQRLLGDQYPDVTTAVHHLTAVQAQEVDDACRMVSRRVVGGPPIATIADQVATGDIVRTHVLRPTWHFVRAVDLDWMLDLTAERVHAQMRPYYRSGGFEHDKDRAVALIADILDAATEPLTRQELGIRLGERGFAISGMPLSQLTLAAELDGVAITGPRRGSKDTFVPYRSRVPQSVTIDREEAVATLARRYLDSHAPATHKDFAWWSGLTLADARAGFTTAGAMEVLDGLFSPSPVAASARGTAHLLSVFDEYVIAYADRSALSDAGDFVLGSRNLMLIDGAVVGTWRIIRPTRKADQVSLELTTARELSEDERGRVEAEVPRLHPEPITTRWLPGRSSG